MIRAAALAVLVLVAAAPTAFAWTAPGQGTAAPAVQQVAAQGLAFWRARGFTNCPQGPIIWQAPHLFAGDGDAWGRGDGATCEMWISDSLAKEIIWPASTFGGALDACEAVTHEVGHALGLPHSDSGVMAAVAPPVKHMWTPGFCYAWARRTVGEVLAAYGYSGHAIRRMMREFAAAARRGVD